MSKYQTHCVYNYETIHLKTAWFEKRFSSNQGQSSAVLLNRYVNKRRATALSRNV